MFRYVYNYDQKGNLGLQVGNKHYLNEKDVPDMVRLFPLEGLLLLPGSILPLNIFEPRYLEMFDDALATDRIIGLVQPNFAANFAANDAEPVADLCHVGTLSRIISLAESGDGRYMVSLGGICRFRLKSEHDAKRPYRMAQICPFVADLTANVEEVPGYKAELMVHFNAYVKANDIDVDMEEIDQLGVADLVNLLSSLFPFDVKEKQALLEADIDVRVPTLIALLEMSQSGGPDDGRQTVQ